MARPPVFPDGGAAVVFLAVHFLVVPDCSEPVEEGGGQPLFHNQIYLAYMIPSVHTCVTLYFTTLTYYGSLD